MRISFELYKQDFTKEALNCGYSTDSIQKCLDYAKPLVEQGLPIIYNLTHLSKLTGYTRKYVVQAAVVSNHSDAYYRYYRIKKKNGKQRQILEPLPNLKDIQRWILENVLEKVQVSIYAKAYIKGRGLKENLKFHRGQKKVFSIDLLDFFTKVTLDNVQKVFGSLGYSDTLVEYLSKLCCLEGVLPQGAPTSPYLSNLVMRQVDDLIGEYCSKRDIRYTRYSDDLTFSGEFDEKSLEEEIVKILTDRGYPINSEKTKLMMSYERQYVTGIVVNDKIQLSKADRNELRQVMYYIRKNGFERHVQNIGIDKRNYLNHLIGKVGFGLYLNPNDEKLKGYLEELKKVRIEERNLPF